MRRSELMAYLVGAAVAGTILVLPYAARAVALAIAPDVFPVSHAPFFLLPVAWGLWNWLWVRRRLRVGIGLWGGLLGLGLGAGMNLILVAVGVWFPAALLLPIALPPLYYLLWRFLVGPLNEALGAEG